MSGLEGLHCTHVTNLNGKYPVFLECRENCTFTYTFESRRSICRRGTRLKNATPIQNVRHEFGTQGRNVCIGFCTKVSVYRLQRGKYLMRRHDFINGISSAKISYRQKRWKKIYLLLPDSQKTLSQPNPAHPATHPPTPMGFSVIAEYEIIFVPNTASTIAVWLSLVPRPALLSGHPGTHCSRMRVIKNMCVSHLL